MVNKNKLKGEQAEELSLLYLQNKGYRIITHNYRSRYGEIDIIVTKDEFIVFVEVKARSKDIAAAFSSVSIRKRLKLIRTALDFLVEHPEFSEHCMRFDVIGIIARDSDRRS